MTPTSRGRISWRGRWRSSRKSLYVDETTMWMRQQCGWMAVISRRSPGPFPSSSLSVARERPPHVASHQVHSLCNMRLIGADSIFHFDEIWDGIPDGFVAQDRRQLGASCKKNSARDKPSTLERCISVPSRLPLSLSLLPLVIVIVTTTFCCHYRLLSPFLLTVAASVAAPIRFTTHKHKLRAVK